MTWTILWRAPSCCMSACMASCKRVFEGLRSDAGERCAVCMVSLANHHCRNWCMVC